MLVGDKCNVKWKTKIRIEGMRNTRGKNLFLLECSGQSHLESEI